MPSELLPPPGPKFAIESLHRTNGLSVSPRPQQCQFPTLRPNDNSRGFRFFAAAKSTDGR